MQDEILAEKQASHPVSPNPSGGVALGKIRASRPRLLRFFGAGIGSGPKL